MPAHTSALDCWIQAGLEQEVVCVGLAVTCFPSPFWSLPPRSACVCLHSCLPGLASASPCLEHPAPQSV